MSKAYLQGLLTGLLISNAVLALFVAGAGWLFALAAVAALAAILWDSHRGYSQRETSDERLSVGRAPRP